MTSIISNTDLKICIFECEQCQKCPLCKTRTNIVFGAGNPFSRVMFIGEAPGKNEDEQGVPFVGAAGNLLNELLEGIDYTRNDIYIANILKCRPPRNRDPKLGEVEACTPWLLEQIKCIKPKVLVTLGNFATHFVLNADKGVGISKLRGVVYTVNENDEESLFDVAWQIEKEQKTNRTVQFSFFKGGKSLMSDSDANTLTETPVFSITKVLSKDAQLKPDSRLNVTINPQIISAAGADVQVLPMFHPASAIYKRSNIAALKDDFAQLKEILI